MTGRTVYSRPRTRIYDANYNIGENYYRPALDRIDRKYFGRTLSPQPRETSLPRDLLDRHDRAFANEDLTTARRRAEKHITKGHLFDSRGAPISQALDLASNFIDEETASALKRIRANKKVSMIDDIDFESAVNNINSRKMLERSDRALKTVGLDENARRALDEDIIIKRRTLKITNNEQQQQNCNDYTRWTPLEEKETSAAAIRARQTRDRLQDLEDEMAALTEKQIARERRAARLKAFVAENLEDTEAAQTAIKAVSFKARREQKILEE